MRILKLMFTIPCSIVVGIIMSFIFAAPFILIFPGWLLTIWQWIVGIISFAIAMLGMHTDAFATAPLPYYYPWHLMHSDKNPISELLSNKDSCDCHHHDHHGGCNHQDHH